MKIKISDNFTLKKILLFSLPCIGMQLVDNTYQLVDGYFISNYLGEEVFAAENMIYPPLVLLMSIGLVIGAGGSAIISSYLGEGKKEEAKQTLTMLSVFLFVVSVILSAISFIFMAAISKIAGATDNTISFCTAYGRILAVFMPAQIMNFAFQEFLIVADESKLGLFVSIVNAVTNIILDFLFVGVFGFGLPGAAAATGIAWCVSGIVAIVYFLNRNHELHFSSFPIHFKDIGLSLTNGSSEMVDGISYAIVAVIFNRCLVRLLSERGVAAYAVTEYVTGTFYAIFMGFGIAIIPVFGYRLGEKNFDEVKRLRNMGFKISLVAGGIMAVCSLIFAPICSQIFVGYDTVLKDMSTLALRICGISFLIGGFNMFSSSYFTGLSNGLFSAIIAFARSFVFPIVFVFLLPYIFGSEAIWYTTLMAEAVTMIITIYLHIIGTKKMMDVD